MTPPPSNVCVPHQMATPQRQRAVWMGTTRPARSRHPRPSPPPSSPRVLPPSPRACACCEGVEVRCRVCVLQGHIRTYVGVVMCTFTFCVHILTLVDVLLESCTMLNRGGVFWFCPCPVLTPSPIACAPMCFACVPLCFACVPLCFACIPLCFACIPLCFACVCVCAIRGSRARSLQEGGVPRGRQGQGERQGDGALCEGGCTGPKCEGEDARSTMHTPP
jgi:hypothetical protein